LETAMLCETGLGFSYGALNMYAQRQNAFAAQKRKD